MFQMPMSSPMMTTMFGWLCAACETAGVAALKAIATPAIAPAKSFFHLI
jgi:hypothetical protein